MHSTHDIRKSNFQKCYHVLDSVLNFTKKSNLKSRTRNINFHFNVKFIIAGIKMVFHIQNRKYIFYLGVLYIFTPEQEIWMQSDLKNAFRNLLKIPFLCNNMFFVFKFWFSFSVISNIIQPSDGFGRSVILFIKPLLIKMLPFWNKCADFKVA